jgi:hypothetical protein
MQDASNQRAKRIKAAIATFAVGFAVLIGLGAFVLTANAPSRLVRIGAPGVKALGPAGATVLGSPLEGVPVGEPGPMRGLVVVDP